MAFQPHSFMFQSLEEDHHDHDQHHHHNNIASNPNNFFHGIGTTTTSGTLGHHHHHGAAPFMMMKRSLSFSGIEDDHHNHHIHQGGGGGGGDQDDMSDDGSQIGEKKKRLNLEQVRTLEKSFEIGNKLDPERKCQLAKALGLQPRQVAIWFQNRRARWKTKQLEKDYDVLRKQFDLLKADNDSLHSQNKKLHAELSALKGIDSSDAGIENHNNKKDIQTGDQGSWSNNGSDQNSSDNNNINLDISRSQVVNNTTSSASSQLAQGKNLFPSSLRPSSITQLLQGSSRSSDLHCLKLDHPHQMGVQSDENNNFCNNMFVNNGNASVGDQSEHHQTAGYWPWQPEQHYFH